MAKLLERLRDERFFIVNEPGPTKFLVKDNEGATFTIRIGNPHSCTCSNEVASNGDIKSTEKVTKKSWICVHLLFIFTRKFRLAETNPLIWQAGMTDAEVGKLLCGMLGVCLKEGRRRSTRVGVSKRDLEKGDICPICQEDLDNASVRSLTFCQFSCGKILHATCMAVWLQHRRSRNEDVTCPFCREVWNARSIKKLLDQIIRYKAMKRFRRKQRREKKNNEAKTILEEQPKMKPLEIAGTRVEYRRPDVKECISDHLMFGRLIVKKPERPRNQMNHAPRRRMKYKLPLLAFKQSRSCIVPTHPLRTQFREHNSLSRSCPLTALNCTGFNIRT